MLIRKVLFRSAGHRLLYRAGEGGMAGVPKRGTGETLAGRGPVRGRAVERLARQVAFR
jgi:hypothetical protein